MIQMSYAPVEPVDRKVAVTVTLLFNESEIREREFRCELSRWLGEEFKKSLTTGPDPYPVLEALV